MNKRLIALVICITFGFTTLSVVLAQWTQLLPNPNFDTGADWYYHTIQENCYATWWEGGGHNANGSADVVSQNGEHPECEGYTHPNDDIGPDEYQPGDTCEFSFWVRNYSQPECNDGSWIVRMFWTTDTVSYTEFYEESGQSAIGDWVFYEYHPAMPDIEDAYIEVDLASSYCSDYVYDDLSLYCNAPYTPTATVTPTATITETWSGDVCHLENSSFEDGISGWSYGDWVIEGPGFVELHGNSDTLVSWIAQDISLAATGPTEHYRLTINARSTVPIAPENAPYIRYKLNGLVPGSTPYWFSDQAQVTSWGTWQFNSWILRDSNSSALEDTLTIWAQNGDLQIDSVCISLISSPGTVTPICPPSPTYTPRATYTPLPTPTAINTATATAWAATATAWPTQAPYPTQAAANCTVIWEDPGWDFIWLAGQLLGFLAAFFTAIFSLLATVLQPIFDLIGFIVWLLGAAFSLISALIDLVGTVLQFLLSLLGLSFDILEIIAAFFSALWLLISSSPIDPGFAIPTDWAWPIAAWNFMIEGTALELLEPVAIGIGSLLMILWTIRQFSGDEA